MDRYEFALANGIAHVCERGNCWSLCGWQTSRTVADSQRRGRGVPCPTCLERAAERIALAETSTH